MAKAENRYRQADAKEDPAVSRRVSGKSIELQD
jgi:hypothetical protein